MICPNCEAHMDVGEPCPECNHVNEPYCDCGYCTHNREVSE